MNTFQLLCKHCLACQCRKHDIENKVRLQNLRDPSPVLFTETPRCRSCCAGTKRRGAQSHARLPVVQLCGPLNATLAQRWTAARSVQSVMPGQSCSARSASASISALWDSFPPVAGVLHTLQRRLAAAHQLAQKLSSGPLNNKERAHGVTFSASRSASPASRSASPASRSASPASRSASRLQTGPKLVHNLVHNWSTKNASLSLQAAFLQSSPTAQPPRPK